MSYHHFANLYDELMRDVPYHLWVDFVINKTQPRKQPLRVLELGCGTGTLAIELKERGLDVNGLDLSADMLTIAQQKARERGLDLPLYEKSMTDLHGLPSYEVILIFCDSLNYLLDAQEVEQTFKEAYHHLEEEGLLLFDVHSVQKINDIFIGNTFGSNEENISFIWKCFAGEWKNSVEHDLTFFVRDGDSYRRIDETHIQRTFTIEEYETMLTEAGFEVVEVCGDFTKKNNPKAWERVFFTAKKPKNFEGN